MYATLRVHLVTLLIANTGCNLSMAHIPELVLLFSALSGGRTCFPGELVILAPEVQEELQRQFSWLQQHKTLPIADHPQGHPGRRDALTRWIQGLCEEHGEHFEVQPAACNEWAMSLHLHQMQAIKEQMHSGPSPKKMH